jgi:hypothetical protein
MLRKLTSLGIVFFASVFVPSCSEKECTLIGCASSLTIDFSGATDSPGRYRIEMVADGVGSVCEVTLPAAGSDACSFGSTPVLDAPWRVEIRPDKTDGIDRVAGIVFYNSAPASITFTVRRDDKIVGGGDSLKPMYTESFPNGPECGPACRQAPNLEVQIDP